MAAPTAKNTAASAASSATIAKRNHLTMIAISLI
jgi:hypothetical protein